MKVISALCVLAFGLAQAAPLEVVTSNSIFADWANVVGRPYVNATSVVPPGVDPHTFEPKPSSIRLLSKASLYVYGSNLEPFSAKLIGQLPKQAKVLDTLNGLSGLIHLEEGHEEHGAEEHHDEHAHGDTDPHAWMDPNLAQTMVKHMSDTLGALDPAHAAFYKANAKAYNAKIAKQHRINTDCFAKVKQRNVIAQHESLAYFARSYNINIVGTLGDFSGQDKGAKNMIKLSKAIKQQQVAAILIEPQFASQTASTLATQRVPLVTVYSDALDGKVFSYLALMKHNGKVVCAALH